MKLNKRKVLKVYLSGLSSDLQETTFALCINSHNAYFGCHKCTTIRHWVQNIIRHHAEPKTGGRGTYSELDALLRTDLSFRQRSIIENILRDVVNDKVLDDMPIVCIGVNKKRTRRINKW